MNQHFYINLDERPQRNKDTIRELRKLGIREANRMSAVKHEIGLIGCAFSHIKVIQKAKELGWKYCIVFEDDILIDDGYELKVKINKYLDYDYDVLYLGCWNIEPPEMINEDLMKVSHAWTTHAYIIKEHYYDTLIENLKEGCIKKMKDPDNGDYNIDEYVSKLQEKDKWLCLNPIMVTQRDGWSDNFNCVRELSEEIKSIPR